MGRARRILLLLTLYLAQGMPFGFQANALPAYLRHYGLSRTSIGLLGVLAVPWLLKPLWAPFVDRWLDRRTWIVAMLAAMAATSVAAAFVPPDRLGLLAVLVLVMNVLAATQDIAVDGLAVDILEEDELGPGNAAQVVGYKLGMLTGGGLLVAVSADLGWRVVFLGMAAVFVLVMFVARGVPAARHQTLDTTLDVLRRLWRALVDGGAGWLLVFIATYKLGETLVDAMWKPFLVDVGFTPDRIGLYVGTYGMVASVLGSIAGGLLARRLPILSAVFVAAVFRIFPLTAEWLMTLTEVTDLSLAAVTCAEHFFGGALTTTVFALMMSRVDKRIGATHFTLFAAIEVWGKLPVASASGALADRFGYPPLFLAGVVLSVGFLVLFVPLRRDR